MAETATQTDTTGVSETAGESWMDGYESLSDPEVRKSLSKYKDENSAMAGLAEAQKKIGRPYWLPEKHDSLTEEQKAEIRSNVALMDGVPKTAEDYVLTDTEEDAGLFIDPEVVVNYKKMSKELNIPPVTVQKLYDFQKAFVRKQNEWREQAIKEMQQKTFDRLAKELKSPDAVTARMEWIMQYLKDFAKKEDGTFDQEEWDAFSRRNFWNNQGHEYILMAALSPIAQQLKGTGGSPPGGTPMAAAKGSLSYPEMQKK